MALNGPCYRALFLIALFIFLATMMSGCTSTKTHIAATDLLNQINTGTAPLIVDVRSQSEYKASHVPGALHIPFWSAFTSGQLDQADKNRDLVVYCEHGPRAGIAKMAFSLSGFDSIYYLEGHMVGWKRAQLPVEISPK